MRTYTLPTIHTDVGEIGYGLMGLTWRPHPPSEEESFKAMKAALARGCNFWNGGVFYGTPEHNSLTLLNKYFTKYPEDAAKVVLSIKGCVDLQTWLPNCSPAAVRGCVENALRLLPPSVKVIDFFEPARLDPNVSIEDTVGTLAQLIREGKVKGYMLSEVGGDTIRRANAIHPVGAVELELSLWMTEIFGEESGAARACQELSVPVVAYSPIGRGMFSGQIRSLEDIPEDDMRRHLPRFQPDALYTNLKLVDELRKYATKRCITPTQLALAWILARPLYSMINPPLPTGILTVIPIPGSSSEARVTENAQASDVEWTDADETEVSRILKEFVVVGARYPMAKLDD